MTQDPGERLDWEGVSDALEDIADEPLVISGVDPDTGERYQAILTRGDCAALGLVENDE